MRLKSDDGLGSEPPLREQHVTKRKSSTDSNKVVDGKIPASKIRDPNADKRKFAASVLEN